MWKPDPVLYGQARYEPCTRQRRRLIARAFSPHPPELPSGSVVVLRVTLFLFVSVPIIHHKRDTSCELYGHKTTSKDKRYYYLVHCYDAMDDSVSLYKDRFD